MSGSCKLQTSRAKEYVYFFVLEKTVLTLSQGRELLKYVKGLLG